MFLQILTENNYDCLDEVDHGLLITWMEVCVFGHSCHLSLDIDEDVSVDNHHDEENEKIRDGPEGQVAAAVEGSHFGASVQATQTVPTI